MLLYIVVFSLLCKQASLLFTGWNYICLH